MALVRVASDIGPGARCECHSCVNISVLGGPLGRLGGHLGVILGIFGSSLGGLSGASCGASWTILRLLGGLWGSLSGFRRSPERVRKGVLGRNLYGGSKKKRWSLESSPPSWAGKMLPRGSLGGFLEPKSDSKIKKKMLQIGIEQEA